MNCDSNTKKWKFWNFKKGILKTEKIEIIENIKNE